jgi:maltose alpha-D-glucosyltransferase/alpha-amylase
MEIKPAIDRMKDRWSELYPGKSIHQLEEFIEELELVKEKLELIPHEPEWYMDVTVYSLYVDLFNKDFSGLKSKLDYLEGLGINCLWLLPILDSPGKDAGFDISDYMSIRPQLLGLSEKSGQNEREQAFRAFLEEAHKRNIKVIFDIAINHTSDQHPWFRESRESADNPYRDYYIWSKDTSKYNEARIIFEGLCHSNWEKDGDWYYFHRFFEFQPDLNYRNPSVLLEMSGNLVYWLQQGVDGFRADAIPYLWKEEGTDCENQPLTHSIVQFFRAVLDFVRPDTLLLAEACQKPNDVIRYFGNGDECNAGYHFPLMPQMFKALASESSIPVRNILSKEVTPAIPENAQWFTFLRCHDELSLELVYVSEEDRKYIHDNYCKQPLWDFRLGQGVSARLAELFDRNPRRILLAYSLMLSLPGTPVIYYGDEFGKVNDEDYYREMIKLTGKDDTRFLVRGRIDWEEVEKKIKDTESYEGSIFHALARMINTRKLYFAFGRGRIDYLDVEDDKGNPCESVFAFHRTNGCERLLIIHNLSGIEMLIKTPNNKLYPFEQDLLDHPLHFDEEKGLMILPPHAYYWILT